MLAAFATLSHFSISSTEWLLHERAAVPNVAQWSRIRISGRRLCCLAVLVLADADRSRGRSSPAEQAAAASQVGLAR
jgi:hypothetical protein